MRKLSVFYEHILQACEQSGKTIPEVLAFCREQGISAVEMNYSLFASEREVIAPMLSDAGLVIIVAVVAVAVLLVLFYNEGWWKFNYLYKFSMERGGNL